MYFPFPSPWYPLERRKNNIPSLSQTPRSNGSKRSRASYILPGNSPCALVPFLPSCLEILCPCPPWNCRTEKPEQLEHSDQGSHQSSLTGRPWCSLFHLQGRSLHLFPFGLFSAQGTAGLEVTAYEEMSSLVNYIQPIKFNSFEVSASKSGSVPLESRPSASRVRRSPTQNRDWACLAPKCFIISCF